MLKLRKGEDPNVVVGSLWKAVRGSAREGWRDYLKLPSEVPPVDVLIVGAGAVGLFTAYHLLRQGLKVALVDKAIGSGASWHNTGVVSPIPDVKLLKNHSWMKLYREAFHSLSSFIEGTLPLVRGRGEVVVLSEEEFWTLRRWVDVERRDALYMVEESLLLQPYSFMSALLSLIAPKAYVVDEVEAKGAKERGLWAVSTNKGLLEARWLVWTGKGFAGYVPLTATLGGGKEGFVAPLRLEWAVRELKGGIVVFDKAYPLLSREVSTKEVEVVKAIARSRLQALNLSPRIAYVWGLPLSLTATGLPLVKAGERRVDVYMGIGSYVWAWYIAERIAEAVRMGRAELAAVPLGKVPIPRPVAKALAAAHNMRAELRYGKNKERH